MATPHKAMPDDWKAVELNTGILPACSCLLELRDRIEALEAAASAPADHLRDAPEMVASAPAPAIGPEWRPCVKLPITVHVREQRPGETHIGTREGITPVRPDDLIMRGVQGEEYPIGRELFNQTYRMGESAETQVPAPASGLVERLMDEGYAVTHARAAILAAADYMDNHDWPNAARWLREEVQRHG